MLNNAIIIAKDIQLTFKLIAREIYVSNEGDLILIVKQTGPYAPFPKLTVDYLEYLCCAFYYGGKPHKHAIADILLLNNLLTVSDYGGFYDSLHYNLNEQNITIISSDIFQ